VLYANLQHLQNDNKISDILTYFDATFSPPWNPAQGWH